MDDLNNSNPRRKFLGTLAAGTAGVLGLASLQSATNSIAVAQNGPKGNDPEFEAWLGKIKGRHKQIFDAPDWHEGMPLVWSRVFLMSNEQLGVSPSDITAVVVLRHNGIPLAMEDRLWEKYKFGEAFKVTDMRTNAPATRHIFMNMKEGDFPLPGVAVNELVDSGVLIGVCDLALTVYSKMTAEKMKMDAEEVKKDWVSGLLPGVQRLPSGVLAINRAQERGCTYCFAG